VQSVSAQHLLRYASSNSAEVSQLLLHAFSNGGAESDGHENDGPSKLQGMKLQDMKMQDMNFQYMTNIV